MDKGFKEEVHLNSDSQTIKVSVKVDDVEVFDKEFNTKQDGNTEDYMEEKTCLNGKTKVFISKQPYVFNITTYTENKEKEKEWSTKQKVYFFLGMLFIICYIVGYAVGYAVTRASIIEIE